MPHRRKSASRLVQNTALITNARIGFKAVICYKCISSCLFIAGLTHLYRAPKPSTAVPPFPSSATHAANSDAPATWRSHSRPVNATHTPASHRWGPLHRSPVDLAFAWHLGASLSGWVGPMAPRSVGYRTLLRNAAKDCSPALPSDAVEYEKLRNLIDAV